MLISTAYNFRFLILLLFWLFQAFLALLWATYARLLHNYFRLQHFCILRDLKLSCFRGIPDTDKVSTERFFSQFRNGETLQITIFCLDLREGREAFHTGSITFIFNLTRIQNCNMSWWIYSPLIFWQRTTATTVDLTLCSNTERSKPISEAFVFLAVAQCAWSCGTVELQLANPACPRFTSAPERGIPMAGKLSGGLILVKSSKSFSVVNCW